MVVVRGLQDKLETGFVLEIRPRCGDRKISMHDLDAEVIRQVCSVDLESFSIDEGSTLLSVKLTPSCDGRQEVASFDMNNFCKH